MKNLLALSLLILCVACEHTTVRQNPDFAKTWSKNYSVAMLPPDAKISYIQFNSDNKRLPEEEAKAENIIRSESAKIFKSKGYKFIDVNFEDYYEQYPELKFNAEKIRESSNIAMDDLYERPTMEPEEAYNFRKSVGSEVNIFASAVGADLLLVTKYEGFEKSDGMVAKDVAASVLLGALTGVVHMSPSEAGGLDALLIDGTTGDILWTNSGATTFPLNKFNPNSDGEDDSGLFSVTTEMTPLGVVFEPLPDKSKPAPKD